MPDDVSSTSTGADEPSLRESLSAAYAEQAGKGAEESPREESTNSEPKDKGPEEKPGRARDNGGRFAKPEAAKPVDAQAAAPTEGAEASATTAAQSSEPAEARPASRAPQSLPEVYRRDWAALKPDLQEAILRREGQVSQALRGSAEARKLQQDFAEVVKPYVGKLTAPPLQRFGELLHATDRLTHGSPEEKADWAAQLMDEFKIPLDLFVARLEAGRPLVPQYRDPRLDNLEKRLNQYESAREQQHYGEVTKRVEAFATDKPHFAKVQMRMARMADDAAARGEPDPDLNTLYEEACWADPEVRKLMLREQSAQGTASAATQRARAASTSPRTNPSSAPVRSDDSIRGLLREEMRRQRK